MSGLDTQLGIIDRYFGSAAGEVFLPDLCDLIEAATASDGMDGHTTADDPLIEDVNCVYEEVSGGSAQVVVNGVAVIATHRIEMKTSDEALALTPHGKIRIQARGDKPEMIFEQPVRTEQSVLATVEFKAILVKEGYRQPGIT